MVELIDKLRQGDETAFLTMVSEQQPMMMRVAMQYVRTHATAEEVVQETWEAALNGLDRFEGRSSFRTWLFQILANRARTRSTRDARMLTFTDLATDEASGDEPAVDPSYFQSEDGEYPGHWAGSGPREWGTRPDEALLGSELREHIEREVSELPEAQRTVMTLRDIEGWSSEEVRNALELSEANQRVLLHRARTKVRRALHQYVKGTLP